MALSEIVSVAIQAGTVNPARAGFGVPLLLMYHDAWAGDEVRTYTTFTGVAADFASDDADQRAVYLAAQALFNQSPRPSRIKIARLPTPSTGQVVTIDGNDHPSGAAITGTVVAPDGTSTAISEAWDTNLATTIGNLATTLGAISGLTAGSVTSNVFGLTADDAGRLWAFEFSDGVDIRETTADWDHDTRLDNVVTVDADFYAVIVDSNSPVNMDKVARWALSNDRIALFAPQYTKPSQFQASEFTLTADYTALQANDSAAGLFTAEPRTSFKEAAWAGLMLPKDPGSATWNAKTLEGVGADTWTSTERTTIEGYNGNHYATEANVGITRPGKAFGGEWLDVVRGLAWFEARLQERLFALLVNNDKIPYTDAGMSLIRAEIEAQLQEAEDRDVFDSGWSVTIPLVADQSTADRAARLVRDIEFQARLAGAAHTFAIAGTVTV